MKAAALTECQVETYDLIVVGAGPVGLSFVRVLNRHFPDDLQVCRNHTPRTTVEGTEFSPQPTDGPIFRFSCVWKAICPYFRSSRQTPPVVFT